MEAFTSNGVQVLGAAFCLGGLLHLTWFRVGEWDLWLPTLVVIFPVLYVLLICFFSFVLPSIDGVWKSLVDASTLYYFFLGGIFTSIGLYRSLFHPLQKFPGPFLARVSNIHIARLSLRKLHAYEEVQRLHQTYGDIVRVGPSELSISSPAALQAIHSTQSPCSKGPWYHLLLPMKAVQTTRDRAEHTYRRKTWDKAFSATSLRAYETRVSHYTDQLLNKIQAQVGKPTDATDWCNYYGFDVMGDLAFGKSFNMLKDGEAHPFMVQMHGNSMFTSALGRFPWVATILKKVPIINSVNKGFLQWLGDQVKQRTENEPELPDIFSWVLGAYKSIPRPSPQDTLNLHGDANLIVVAGSDTTSAALTCILFELTRHPHVARELQKELDQYYSQNGGPDHMELSKLSYLQAVINEVLRMYPPVPSGLQRVTPPEGLKIGDTFIPGNTLVQVPTYTLHRDERVFPRANEFIPERWTSKSGLVKDASAFAPFSTGRYSCVGKQLASMEMRYVISQILSQYDLSFAPGQSPQEFLDGLIDGFVLLCPKLDLVFTPRA